MTKAAVMEKLDEYAAANKKMERLIAKQSDELMPFELRYTQETAPINAKYEAKIGELSDLQAAIEEEVTEYLAAANKDQIIASSSGVIAEQKTEIKTGPRVIDVEKFLAAAKPKGTAMFDCVKILVAKAEKLLGMKEIDKIATKEETETVVRQVRMQ